MKLMRVASMALAAYLVSSALLARFGIVEADHDAVRLHEVVDRGAFLQEFRIADDMERDVHAALLEFASDRALDLLGGADRHGRLVDDHGRFRQALADAACSGQDVGQVGAAVFVRRRADGQEDDVGVVDGIVIVRREQQAAGSGVALDEAVQAGFVDGDDPVLQHRDLARVDVQAQHGIADVGETCARHQSDVTSPDN
jgi:hypothetical protein